MSDEWGPWIEHDGKGCPCLGKYIRFEADTKISHFTHGHGIIISEKCGEYIPRVSGESWTWGTGFANIIRYRIRKPKGLTILESILREVEHTRTPEYTAG